MTEQTYSGWTMQHDSNGIGFFLNGVRQFGWGGTPQMSKEHLALVTHAFEVGRDAGLRVPRDKWREWERREGEILSDWLGLRDEKEEFFGEEDMT